MKNFKVILFTIFSLAILINLEANAQQKELKFKYLSVKNGLSQSTVFAITQDHNGLMWFGTRTGGLNKYDGYSFTAYKHNPDDSCSISGNEITSVLEDSQGNIWVGTRGRGLNRLDYKTDCFFRYFQDKLGSELLDNTINQIFEDAQKRVWVATNQGLCLYQPKTDNFKYYLHDATLNSSTTTAIIQANENQLWVGTKEGLFLLNIQTGKYTYFTHEPENKHSLSEEHITNLLLDYQRRLWVGTRNEGLNVLIDKDSHKFSRLKNEPDNPNSLTSNIIRTLHKDKKGTIWVGTKQGIEELIPEEQEKTNPIFVHHQSVENNDNSLNQNSIYSFYEDNRGNFWIGTWSGGLNYLSNEVSKFEHFKQQIFNDKSLSNNAVSSFVEDKNGVWVGTEGGGLNFFNREKGTFTHYKADEKSTTKLNSNHVKSLYIDVDNDLWVGTFKGLQLFDRETKKFKLILTKQSVYSITAGIKNELWFGTSKKLYKFDKLNEKFTEYEYSKNDTNTIRSNTINIIYKDSDNKIWVGTKKGLHYYNREQDNFTRYLHSSEDRTSISNDHITTICEDQDGNLWIGTYDGLNLYHPKTNSFKLYGEKIGLPDNVINSMLSDSYNNLWITTNKGLSKFSLRALEIFEKRQSNLSTRQKERHSFLLVNNQNPIVRNYDKADGLQANEFIKNACYKNDAGELFFGGINGFNIFHPSKIKNNNHTPKIVITEFRLFNQPVRVNGEDSPLKQHISETKELVLNHKQSVITFEFVALNFSSPEKNQYAYIMEGFEKKWNYVGHKREATYTNLPAGSYTFRVKASNNDGIWNEKGISLRVNILPPWWDTKSFKGSITVFVIIAILTFYFYRINALKKQKLVLEKMVQDRTVKLQEAVVESEEKQEEIQQQNEEIQNQAEELKRTNMFLGDQKSEIEKAYSNSQILSEFGQKITSTLDIENISNMIYQYLCSLMEISAFGIGLYDEATQEIEFFQFIENEERVPYFSRAVSDKKSLISWCFREQKTIFINDLERDYRKYLDKFPSYPTSASPLSDILLPLSTDKKKIGVITVNSFERNAYSKEDFTNLKTVASYLAIALDNANAYRLINKKNRSIESSIRYAQTIQQAILPPAPKLDKYFENFILFEPKDIVSGDFYWATLVKHPDNTESIFVAVVDCTGHGVPGAFMSIIGTTFLNEIIKVKEVYELPKILERLDNRVKDFLKQDEGNNDDGMDVCLCKIDQCNVEFSGAKRPLIYWKKQTNELLYVKGSNKSIGGRDSRQNYFHENKIALNQGDILYLTSDGYVDQCNPKRRKFGTTRFKNLLEEIAPKPMQEQHDELLQAQQTYQENEEQRDDITMVGIRLGR